MKRTRSLFAGVLAIGALVGLAVSMATATASSHPPNVLTQQVVSSVLAEVQESSAGPPTAEPSPTPIPNDDDGSYGTVWQLTPSGLHHETTHDVQCPGTDPCGP